MAITKRHDKREVSIFEVHKLERDLGREYNLLVKFELTFRAERLIIVARAYKVPDGPTGAVKHQALASLSITDARPIQTPLYWLLWDVYRQAENEELVKETQKSPALGDGLPI